MTLKQLSQEIQKETDLPYYTIFKVISAMTKVIARVIIEGRIVKLSGLMTLRTEIRPAKNYYDVHQQKVVRTKAKFYLKTNVSPNLKVQLDAKTAYSSDKT